jgi:hypothetical protein
MKQQETTTPDQTTAPLESPSREEKKRARKFVHLSTPKPRPSMNLLAHAPPPILSRTPASFQEVKKLFSTVVQQSGSHNVVAVRCICTVSTILNDVCLSFSVLFLFFSPSLSLSLSLSSQLENNQNDWNCSIQLSSNPNPTNNIHQSSFLEFQFCLSCFAYVAFFINDRNLSPDLLDLGRPALDAFALATDRHVDLGFALHSPRALEERVARHAAGVGALGGHQLEHGEEEVTDAAGLFHAEVVFLAQHVWQGPVAQAVDVAELAFAVEDLL